MKKDRRKYLVIAVIVVFTLLTSAVILMMNATRLIEYRLRETLGRGFSVNTISVSWGRVEASGIILKNERGTEVMGADRVILNADFRSIFHKEPVISSLVLKSPYLLIETDRKGAVINPVHPKKTTQSPPSPLLIQDLTIENGSFEYLNGKIASPPFLTRLQNIHLEFQNIRIPFHNDFSPYSLTADIPGNLYKGTLHSQGRIRLKNLDTESTLTLRSLDVTGFKPYFQKKGDVDITRGLLDLDMTVKISGRKISAPGRAVLKNMEFRSGTGAGRTFLSLPLRAVMSFLKDHNDQIAFDFTLEGDLDNPRFNIRQNFIDKITLGIAEKLGLSVTKIGESIIDLGTEGLKQIGKGIESIGEGIRDIFE